MPETQSIATVPSKNFFIIISILICLTASLKRAVPARAPLEFGRHRRRNTRRKGCIRKIQHPDPVSGAFKLMIYLPFWDQLLSPGRNGASTAKIGPVRVSQKCGPTPFPG